ncbi:flagellar hook-length control protein FliK [Alcaligenaceae bacterium CGII-47]|nr:flagellar hook-length control protein FliK [Alcaligenaceae bacterium CGII-47]
MSIGAPSTLGTLLIQRLDAVLGTTLSQQANLASGARPGAIAQPGSAEDPHAPQNAMQRHPREAVDKASAHEQGRGAIGKANQAEAGAMRAGRGAVQTGTTSSAPTTLGFAARTILALLAEYPDSGQLARGQAPLVAGRGAGAGAGAAVHSSVLAGAPPSGTAAGSAALAGSPAGNAAPVAPPGTGSASLFSTWASLATSLGEPGALPAQFAQSLAQTLQTSGLFYESHLAKLTFGQTSLAALQQEPQGQIKPGGTPGQANAPAPSAASASAPPPSALDPGATSQASTSTSTTSAAGTPPGAGTPQAAIPGIDPQTQLLVRQQLEVLAHQSFAWQGEAWPGAAMDWKVERREQDGGQDNAPEHWATRLNLQLPLLGEVQARLTLAGDQLVMRLVAPQSAERLNAHIESLRGRLLAHGLQPSQLSVLARADPPNDEPDTHAYPAPQS